MFVNGLSKYSLLCLSIRATWSTISATSRFLILLSFAVAQNSQFNEQPTCEETQAVLRLSVGIRTDSTINPSCNFTPFLIVPSVDFCNKSIEIGLMKKSRVRFSLNSLERFVISSKECMFLLQSQS
ncbi:hypothetical protein D3C72_2012560 [compost metagenome]